MKTRQWLIGGLVIGLIGAVFTGTPALAAASENLLSDPGFEGAYSWYATASGWSPWYAESSKPVDGTLNYAYRPTFNVETLSNGAAPQLVLAGNSSQRIINNWDPWWAGVEQVVNVRAGTRVRLTVNARSWAASSNWPTESDPDTAARVQVGLDPTGGFNAFSNNVIWSPAITPYAGWGTVAVEAVVGSSGRVTAFISADYRGFSRAYMAVFFDEASLVKVDPNAPPLAPIVMPSGANAAPAGTYQVKAGDTLSAIARRFNISLTALLAANSLKDANQLALGQMLVIPGQSSVAVSALPPAGTTTHVVVAGDSLNRLARVYNTTLAQLKAWNHLTTDVLQLGQTLVVAP